MKYIKGYIAAAILLACNWALTAFTKGHAVLVDMVYPYVTRMAQTFLAGWSGGVDFCLWQALLFVGIALVLVTAALMIIFKWNPVKWGGWVCLAVAVLIFLNTCLFGLNQYSGSLAEDIRLEETPYDISELEAAAIYYRDQANGLSAQVTREGDQVAFGSFKDLADLADDGFEMLVYEKSLSVFAGPMGPVKELNWAKRYTRRGTTGVTVGLTGEACVNPRTPAVMLPFAMCREMCHQASIVVERDAAFGAYLACMNNPDVRFQYSGALLGYRYCLKALEALEAVSGSGAVARLRAEEDAGVTGDLAQCDAFLGDREREDAKAYDLLTSWHIQEVVLPGLVEEESGFDPMDKTQVDLSDHPDA